MGGHDINSSGKSGPVTRASIIVNGIVINENISPFFIKSPDADIYTGSPVIVQQVVVEINAVHAGILPFSADRKSPFAMVNGIVVKFHLAQMTEPAVGIKSLPWQIVNGIVVNDSIPADFLAIYTLLIAIVHPVIGNFKMGGAGEADSFMRSFPFKSHPFRFQFFIVGSGYFAIQNFAGIRVPDGNAGIIGAGRFAMGNLNMIRAGTLDNNSRIMGIPYCYILKADVAAVFKNNGPAQGKLAVAITL